MRLEMSRTAASASLIAALTSRLFYGLTLETADAAVPFETGASISIVDVLLLGIVQNLKRLGAKFKLRLGLFVPWITVRMILQRGLPICRPDFVWRRGTINSQQFVIVDFFFGHR